MTGPATIGPDGTVVKETATLTKPVKITAWHPIADSGNWRLVFETPADSLEGDLSNLRPDESFSLKYATQVGLLAEGSTPGDGESQGYLSFRIDRATFEDETLTVTLMVLDIGRMSLRNMFLCVTDPRND